MDNVIQFIYTHESRIHCTVHNQRRSVGANGAVHAYAGPIACSQVGSRPLVAVYKAVIGNDAVDPADAFCWIRGGSAGSSRDRTLRSRTRRRIG